MRTREIPGFPSHIMTEDGRIFDQKSGTEVVVHTRSDGYRYCYLTDRYGRRTTRSADKLFRTVWGNSRTDEVRVIPEFPSYVMDRQGNVYGRESGVRIALIDNGRGMYYQLWRDGLRYSRGYSKLVNSVFPKF